MYEEIRLVHRDSLPARDPALAARFGRGTARRACEFHRTFPGYAPTPLVSLEGLAGRLGLSALYVKDESFRFGLNAFKCLGGSYAVARYLCDRLGTDPEKLDYAALTSPETAARLGRVTFVTATDGNHGRGVAWTASRMGQRSVVYLPRGSARERLENIRTLGAEAEITPWNYDDTVRYAKEQGEKNGWVLIQDTAWPGYEEIPAWIMEGYTTIGCEVMEQLGGEAPTHVFLQAGVGALAGALTGFFADWGGERLPTVTVVEPRQADCVFRTAQAMDGTLHTVGGGLDTIMAGLACGEPCSVGWEQLNAFARNFLSVPDWVAARGMRLLGCPLPGDRQIVSGESGAVTAGLVALVMEREELAPIRRTLGLDGRSRVLCVSTEGDTDRENYRRIVWDGLCPSV